MTVLELVVVLGIVAPVLFVLAIGANALIGRLGGLDTIKRT